MKPMLTLSLLLILTIQSAFASQQTGYAHKIEQLAQTAHQYVGFNGTVLVAKSGDIIYHKSFGFADKNQQVPLTNNHKFSPGSIGKEFTTVAIMMLKKQGKLGYDDSLSEHLPNLPKWATTVTIEHILTHTSGLPDIKWQRNQITTTETVVQQIQAVETPAFTPGSDYKYGNINTVLRALLVEKITHKPFEDFLQKRLFDSAGMKHTVTKSQFTEQQSNIVAGTSPSDVAGLTGYVTAEDLFRWEQALYNGTWVDSQTLDQTIVSHKRHLLPGRAYFDFGGFKRQDGQLTQVLHDGSHQRHKAIKFSDFSRSLSIVLMSNDGNKSILYDIRHQISRLDNGESLQIPSSWWLVNAVKQDGVKTTLKKLKGLVKSGKQPQPTEDTLNTMGYRFAGKGQIDDALVLFKYTVHSYPNSANAYDSYAETLIMAKHFELAKPIVERGLQLAHKANNEQLIRTLSAHREHINAIEQ